VLVVAGVVGDRGASPPEEEPDCGVGVHYVVGEVVLRLEVGQVHVQGEEDGRDRGDQQQRVSAPTEPPEARRDATAGGAAHGVTHGRRPSSR